MPCVTAFSQKGFLKIPLNKKKNCNDVLKKIKKTNEEYKLSTKNL